MGLLATDAIVLHTFDYLESSRIVRLATRDGGLRSAVARGARRSQRRFGSGLDLFSQGTAELSTRAERDLDTLNSFEVVRARPGLAADLGRFTGASAIAELVLLLSTDHADPALFEAIVTAFDGIAAAPPERAREATLAGAWRLIAVLGFLPELTQCAECHAPLAADATVAFSHTVGGVLCARCARMAPGGRRIPPTARAALTTWTAGIVSSPLDDAQERAHQRLLREFLHHYVADGRPIRAFDVWEHALWGRT
jgi:DNA repair protein RecO (recombination protein O)